jgi:hypothetical protein
MDTLYICLPISSWCDSLFLNKTGKGICLQEYSHDYRADTLFHSRSRHDGPVMLQQRSVDNKAFKPTFLILLLYGRYTEWVAYDKKD